MLLLITFKCRGVAAINAAFHYDMDISPLSLGHHILLFAQALTPPKPTSTHTHTNPKSLPSPIRQLFHVAEGWKARGSMSEPAKWKVLESRGGDFIAFHVIKGYFCSLIEAHAELDSCAAEVAPHTTGPLKSHALTAYTVYKGTF